MPIAGPEGLILAVVVIVALAAIVFKKGSFEKQTATIIPQEEVTPQIAKEPENEEK